MLMPSERASSQQKPLSFKDGNTILQNNLVLILMGNIYTRLHAQGPKLYSPNLGVEFGAERGMRSAFLRLSKLKTLESQKEPPSKPL